MASGLLEATDRPPGVAWSRAGGGESCGLAGSEGAWPGGHEARADIGEAPAAVGAVGVCGTSWWQRPAANGRSHLTEAGGGGVPFGEGFGLLYPIRRGRLPAAAEKDPGRGRRPLAL